MNAKLEKPVTAKPSQRAKEKKGGFGYPVIIGGAIALGLLAIVSTSFSGGQYSLSLADISADRDSFIGKEMRVSGNIKASTTQMVETQGRMELRFVLTDGEGNDTKIVYPHNPPDPYKEGRSAIVEGKMQNDGSILAHKLTVKCPSKYQTEGGTVDPAKLEEYQKKYGSSGPSAGAGTY